MKYFTDEGLRDFCSAISRLILSPDILYEFNDSVTRDFCKKLVSNFIRVTYEDLEYQVKCNEEINTSQLIDDRQLCILVDIPKLASITFTVVSLNYVDVRICKYDN